MAPVVPASCLRGPSPWLVALLVLLVSPGHLRLAGAVSTEATKGETPVPALGERLDPEAIARLPQTIFPDGRGLPSGSGTVQQGALLYSRLCVQCHGPDGRGGSAPELAGGRSPLAGDYPDQNIGNWWPYATTLFDFIRRAMPMFAPGSLSDAECYALTAWLLERNGLWPQDMPLDAAGLGALHMPNRDGFDSQWPDRGPAHP